MRFIGFVFRWLTFLSLIFWIGVCVYIIQKQKEELPPSGWPQDYQACLTKQAAPEGSQIGNLCRDYYALLGDRTTPISRRFLQQTQGRLTEKVVSTYLAENPLQPGQVVTAQDMLGKLGTKRIAEMVYQVVLEAGMPPSTKRRVESRCKLESAIRYPGISEKELMQYCTRN